MYTRQSRGAVRGDERLPRGARVPAVRGDERLQQPHGRLGRGLAPAGVRREGVREVPVEPVVRRPEVAHPRARRVRGPHVRVPVPAAALRLDEHLARGGVPHVEPTGRDGEERRGGARPEDVCLL